MSRRVVLVLLLAAAACARSPSGPSAQPGVVPEAVRLSGHVTATITGEALAGVQLDLGGGVVLTTDEAGAFAYEWAPGTRTGAARLTMTGDTIVPRVLTLATTESRDVALDAIALLHGFNLDYYRRLARRTLDQADPRPLQRWIDPPMIYLRTIDEQGQPVDLTTLDTVAAAIADEAAAWTGERFGIAGIERGVESREGVAGWVTVKWPNPAVAGICAQAQVAGSWIEFNYLAPSCGCNGSRIGPGIARHEFGHTMGFFHTDEPGDLLSSTLSFAAACSGRPSERERLHAAIAYSRPVGNLDPDTDPVLTVHGRVPDPVVIID